MVAYFAAVWTVLSICIQAATPELGPSSIAHTVAAVLPASSSLVIDATVEADADAVTNRAAGWLLESCAKLFYLVRPSEMALDETDAMPMFILHNGIPMFLLFIMVEFLITRSIVSVRRHRGKHEATTVRAHNATAPEGASASTNDDAAAKSSESLTRQRSWADGAECFFFQIKDLLSCIGVGAGQQVFQFLLNAFGMISEIAVYSFVYHYFRVHTVDVKAHPTFAFVALLLLKDLAYYWQHRMLHEYHVLWASHRVHHSGEEYNLATALRQGAIQRMLGTPYAIPIALLGFPPQVGGHFYPIFSHVCR
jgi:hypothetical protein